MLDRRAFLSHSLLASTVVLLPAAARAAIDPGFATILDAMAQQALRSSPISASYFGLDSGAHAGLRSRLDVRGEEARRLALADNRRFREMLRPVNRAALPQKDALLLDSLNYLLVNGEDGARFAYGSVGTFGGGVPYAVTQQDGAYQSIPDFLDSVHRVENKADAEAYLARLAAFATALDEDTNQVRADAARGVLPPDFLLDTALKQMRGLRAVAPKDSGLVTSLARRTKAANVAGDWGLRAETIVAKSVYPALDRQIAAIAALRPRATRDAGVWKLPDGAGYYRWALQYATSTNLSPDEIHAMGLQQGLELDARMDTVLKAQGMTQGTVGERMSALTRDPKQLFPNNDAGRAEAIAYVNKKLDELRAMMPLYSHMKLRADLVVKRVPPEIEQGAALGYMNFASLDGSRPAIYYINLADTGNWPRFTIPSLTAHEGIPGHAWQGAYMAEHRDDIPLVSNFLGFNAYTEGWALYAEQLVDELGFYKNDPFGQLGMLQALRFRASRLVTDTGLHHKRWGRDQAIDFMQSSTGRSRAACQSEVDRYCASPGQACGYKVGHTEILKLRDKMKTELGDRYDVRDFNDAVIQAGAMPLSVLGTAITTVINEKKG